MEETKNLSREEKVKEIKEELDAEKMVLRDRIQQYYSLFKITPPKKKLDSLIDLERELARCEMMVNKQKDPVEDYKSVIILGSKVLENTSPLLLSKDKFDLTGYSNVVAHNKDNKEFDTAIRELIIKYDLYNNQTTSPEFKLIKIMASQAIIVNELNQKKKVHSESQNQS